tara:strand:+ start:657 stop:3449 length:2793 start_codon:yes stop_codon:yes gene_type:complete
VTTPDKMFTLDPIKTDVTQPLQHLKAHQDSDTSVADAQFSKGLSAFGAAVGDLAERKKQERIDSDIALAKEAAIRNEVMPGGLLPIAVDAFEKTQDIQTANQAYSDIEVFYEGEEVQTITNNSLLTPVQKNSQISTAIDNLFRVSASSVRDADVLLALKNKVDGLKTNSMKAVWNIDKNQKYGVSINAISSQIDNGFDSDIDPEEIFTNKWVKNVAGKLRDGLPWVSGDDAKLTVFSSLANNPNMVSNPDIMTNLMQAEFSKGVTFSALANASTTEAGQQISRIYARFLEKSDRHFADIRREEKEDEDDRNEIATEKGQEFLDSMDDPSDPDYANRFQSLRRIMVDEHNGSVGTFNKLVRIHTTLEEYTKNNFESKEHTDAKILISSGNIKTQREVIEYAERNNLDNESRSLLISFLASDNKEYSKAIDQLKGQTNTVNGSLSSAIRLKIAPNSQMLSMFDHLGPEELKSSKIKISDILGGATVNPNELVDSMIELAELRDKLRVDMAAEVRAAIQEGRPVDSVSIVSSFHKQAQEFIRKIGEPEPEAVEEFEPDEDLEDDTDEANEVENFNTTPEKEAFINTAKLHGSEKPVATFVNGIVKGLEVVRSVPEKAGKFLGEGMVKTFFALKKDIATLTTSDIDRDKLENELKNGGEIPKDVKDVFTKKSWVLDKLLNFFGEDKKKLTFDQPSETTMKFETAPTPAKEIPSSAPTDRNAFLKEQDSLRTEETQRKASGASNFVDSNGKESLLKDTNPSLLKVSNSLLNVKSGLIDVRDASGKIVKGKKGKLNFIYISPIGGTTIIESERSGNNPKKRGAHNAHSGLDIRAEGLRNNPKAAKKAFPIIVKSLETSGYKFIKPKNGGSNYYVEQAGSQFWGMFTKDGLDDQGKKIVEEFMIEIVADRSPHIHIQSGSDYGTTKNIAKLFNKGNK